MTLSENRRLSINSRAIISGTAADYVRMNNGDAVLGGKNAERDECVAVSALHCCEHDVGAL